MQSTQALAATLDHEIDLQWRAHVPPGPVALVGFPSHDNVGDSLIYLGELAILARHEQRIAYVCDIGTYDPRALRRRLPEGTILIHGGGNLGDLWTEHHDLRLAIARDFPRHTVVQLPQTSYFQDPANRELTGAVLGAHPSFHVLCRDRETLTEMSAINGGRASLCPDAAFGLGPQRRPTPEPGRVITLARRDTEAERPMVGVDTVDWIGRSPSAHDAAYRRSLARLMRIEHSVLARARRLGAVDLPASVWAGWFRRLAELRLALGVELIGPAEILVTDRLHAHVLALLLDIPHVVVDSGYGKLSRFVDTWTADASHVRLTRDLADVPGLVAELRG